MVTASIYVWARKVSRVEIFKRLGTEEHDPEEIQQAIDPTGRDAGNCKNRLSR
jgi:hypothetical protein